MEVLLFEDEQLTAERLVQLLNRYDKGIKILDILTSVDAGIKWFKHNPLPELIFMDIQLTDGTCFELFEKVNIEAPIIFTTAYDEYAIKAFKQNSIDYLLKPVSFPELSNAINKFQKIHKTNTSGFLTNLNKLNASIKTYKKRFLIKIGDQIMYIKSSDIAYFLYEHNSVYLYTKANKKYPLDDTLDSIENDIEPSEFFRINRKCLINIDSIYKIHTHFNSRLKIILNPLPDIDIIVSRERVSELKNWLNN